MCKTTYTHSKNRKPLKSCFTSVMKIRLCECSVKYELSFRLRISSVNGDQIRKKLQIWLHLLKKSLMENFNCRFTIKTIISGYARAEPWNQVVRMQWNQGCASAVYNEIVGKLFRLSRCRTIKSSCKNVVRIRLCKRSIQWYCQQRFQVVQI